MRRIFFGNKLFFNFTRKRQFYNYERELRAFNFRFHPKIGKSELSIGEFESLNGFDFGDYIKVDLDILIDQIVLAPNCSNWFFELVENVSKKYGLKKKVKKSELDNDIYQ